jgi:Zn-dependent protease with chaperone function
VTRTETREILLPLLVSILVAIGITYLIITYLPLIIAGVLLFIVAAVLFGAVLTATWFIMQLVLLPYYALRKVKPREEESRGGYRLEEVKQAKSEATETQPESVKPEKFHCPQCGTEAQPDAKFCPHCGAKLR